MLKLNLEMAIEIPEMIILVLNFTVVSMAQRPDFYLLPFGKFREIKWETSKNF
jgi:hypothetical protein